MNPKVEFIYKDLKKQFMGRQMLAPADLAIVTNYNKMTIYNKICEGTFPIPVIRGNRRPRCRLIDVAEYLAGE